MVEKCEYVRTTRGILSNHFFFFLLFLNLDTVIPNMVLLALLFWIVRVCIPESDGMAMASRNSAEKAIMDHIIHPLNKNPALVIEAYHRFQQQEEGSQAAIFVEV